MQTITHAMRTNDHDIRLPPGPRPGPRPDPHGPLALRGRHRLCVAPMMDRTDRHMRRFLRLLGADIVLYTEMVAARALLHGDPQWLLAFDPAEHPVALQLGGSEPEVLARGAALGARYGYDEINLNVGCPSDRVRSGRFGACLMAEPERVADCVAAMRAAVDVPVTVKCRIGIDERDRYADLADFVARVARAGCGLFIVHARRAVLSGLSPKENREIPPLKPERVQRLRRERPDLEIIYNGGIRDPDAAAEQAGATDGVMLGRAAYHDPLVLAAVRARLTGAETAADPHALLEAYLPYVAERLAAGTPLRAMSRHLMGLFQGRPGARRWRRCLSERASAPACSPEAGVEALRAAAAHVPRGATSRVA